MSCPYHALGLHPGAEPEVVEAAIRALRLKYHPDKAGPEGADRFRKISEAARCLRTGESLAQEPPDYEGLRDRLRGVFGSLRNR